LWTRLCQLLVPINTLGADWTKSPQGSLDSPLTAKSHFTSHMSAAPTIQKPTTKKLEEVRVDMAEMKVENRPVVLVTNVGSCVAICIHDTLNKCGGLAHIMLPSSKITQRNSIPSKYADTAVPALTENLEKIAKSRSRLTAKIAGGANMFPSLKANSLNIGEKNVEAVKEALDVKGIKLLAEDVKGTYGRKVVFNITDGSVFVRNGNGEVINL
jgi:chemotaxis protein CheD